MGGVRASRAAARRDGAGRRALASLPRPRHARDRPGCEGGQRIRKGAGAAAAG